MDRYIGIEILANRLLNQVLLSYSYSGRCKHCNFGCKVKPPKLCLLFFKILYSTLEIQTWSTRLYKYNNKYTLYGSKYYLNMTQNHPYTYMFGTLDTNSEYKYYMGSIFFKYQVPLIVLIFLILPSVWKDIFTFIMILVVDGSTYPNLDSYFFVHRINEKLMHRRFLQSSKLGPLIKCVFSVERVT